MVSLWFSISEDSILSNNKTYFQQTYYCVKTTLSQSKPSTGWKQKSCSGLKIAYAWWRWNWSMVLHSVKHKQIPKEAEVADYLLWNVVVVCDWNDFRFWRWKLRFGCCNWAVNVWGKHQSNLLGKDFPYESTDQITTDWMTSINK